MPHVRALLAEQGTSFSQAFVSVSLCCPSRTTILRGPVLAQHRSRDERRRERRVRDRARERRRALDDRDVAPRRRLPHRALRQVPQRLSERRERHVRPARAGTSSTSPTRGGNPYREYDYNLNQNGRRRPLRRRAARLRHRRVQPPGVGLHHPSGARAASRSSRTSRCTRRTSPRPRRRATRDAFPDARGAADAELQRGRHQRQAGVAARHAADDARDRGPRRRRSTAGGIQSLQAVDDSVANLMRHLQRNGQLDNTYVVFASDNGYHLGQHRMPAGKQTAYDEDIHVPLIVRGPGVPADRTRDEIVGNVDLRADVRRARRRDAADVRRRSFVRARCSAIGPGARPLAQRVPGRALAGDPEARPGRGPARRPARAARPGSGDRRDDAPSGGPHGPRDAQRGGARPEPRVPRDPHRPVPLRRVRRPVSASSTTSTAIPTSSTTSRLRAPTASSTQLHRRDRLRTCRDDAAARIESRLL